MQRVIVSSVSAGGESLIVQDEFYELLLDENVALVQIGTEGRLFEYL